MALSTKVREASQSSQPVHYIVFLPLVGRAAYGRKAAILLYCHPALAVAHCPSCPPAFPGRQSKLRSGCVCSVFSAARRDTVRTVRTVSKQTTQCWSKQLKTGSEGGQRGSQSTVGDPKCTTRTGIPPHRSPKCPRSAPSLVAGVVASAAADDDHGLKVTVKSGSRTLGENLDTIYHVNHAPC